MPNHLKNTGDLPLIIHDPDTGEVYSVMPGYHLPNVKLEWPDVRKALQKQGRAQLVSAVPSNKPRSS